MTSIQKPDVRCCICRHRFAAPAVALCPQCGSRQIRVIARVTLDEHLVFALREHALTDGRTEEAALLTRALELAGVE